MIRAVPVPVEAPFGLQLAVGNEHLATGAWMWCHGYRCLAALLFAMSSRHIDLAHEIARAGARGGTSKVFATLKAPPSQFRSLSAALDHTLRRETDAVLVLDLSASRSAMEGDLSLASHLARVLRDQRRLQRAAHSLVVAANRHRARPSAADQWARSCDRWLRSVIGPEDRF